MGYTSKEFNKFAQSAAGDAIAKKFKEDAIKEFGSVEAKKADTAKKAKARREGREEESKAKEAIRANEPVHTEEGEMTQAQANLRLLGPPPDPADFIGGEPEDEGTPEGEKGILQKEPFTGGPLEKFFHGIEGAPEENIYDAAIRKADERRLRRAQEDANYFAAIDAHKLQKELIEKQNDTIRFAAIEATKFLQDKKEQEKTQKDWEDIEEKRLVTKENERVEDETYYAKIAVDKRESELQQQKEDEVYYAKIKTINKAEKAQERKDDEAYWAEIKKQNTGEDLDDADKKILDDWNSGKSALSFSWLGT